jgi:hypothetical protein
MRARANGKPAASFDHLIGGHQHGVGDGEAKRLCRLEVDDELKIWLAAKPADRQALCQPSYFDAESLASSATASCTVVMNWAGKMMVEFFSIEISAIVCRVRS